MCSSDLTEGSRWEAERTHRIEAAPGRAPEGAHEVPRNFRWVSIRSGCELRGSVRLRSPSPQPSPAGRGGDADRVEHCFGLHPMGQTVFCDSVQNGPMVSLSQRERAGVRVNGQQPRARTTPSAH